MQLLQGNSSPDMAVPDFPFCSNSPCQHPPAILITPDFLQVHCFPNPHHDIYRGSSHSSPFIPLFTFSDLFPVHLLEPLFLLLFSYFSLQMALVISLCLIMLKPRLLQKLFPPVSPTIWNSLFFCCFFLPHRFFISFQISSENISAPMPVPLNFSFPLLLHIILL